MLRFALYGVSGLCDARTTRKVKAKTSDKELQPPRTLCLRVPKRKEIVRATYLLVVVVVESKSRSHTAVSILDLSPSTRFSSSVRPSTLRLRRTIFMHSQEAKVEELLGVRGNRSRKGTKRMWRQFTNLHNLSA